MFVEIVFGNQNRTSKETQHMQFTNINWLILFKKIIAFYAVHHTENVIIKYRVTHC